MPVQNDVVQCGVYFSLAVSALGLLAAFLFTRLGIGRDTGHAPLQQQIVGAIKHGAAVFGKRQPKALALLIGLLLPIVAPAFASAQPDHAGGGEANLVLPDLSTVNFFGMNGHALLMIGLLFCVGGLLFGLAIYVQLKRSEERRVGKECLE